MRINGSEEQSQHAEGDHGQEATEKRYAIIAGVNFSPRRVTYNVVDGLAIFEGDIVLGALETLERSLSELPRHRDVEKGFFEPADLIRSVVISGIGYRWPEGLVPYVINPDLDAPGRVTDALQHWRDVTPLSFILRTQENADGYPDYVEFVTGNSCSAAVGMRGGRQTVTLDPDCSEGNVKHEIGHAVGLWHEHSREDRDDWVTINWENIETGKSDNFDQHVTDGDDVGTYDYGSIMHYPPDAFSANGGDTITPVDPAAAIGQRSGLSQGDIDAVEALYPRTIPVPFVRFLPTTLAGARIRQAGLVPKYTGSPAGRNTFVFSQSPNHNHLAALGDTVTLVVRKGPTP